MTVRILCLGNELMADDGFGVRVAEELSALALPDVEIVSSDLCGLNLLDNFSPDINDLIIVDCMMTGTMAVGTIHEISVSDLNRYSGLSPHSSGLAEILCFAEALGLRIPRIRIFVVEAEDCASIGASIGACVQKAIPAMINVIRKAVAGASVAGGVVQLTSS